MKVGKEEIFNVIKEAISYVVPEINVNEITIEDSLKELGANSVDRAEILFMALEDSKVKIPMISFNDAKNIKDIVDIIYQAQQ